MAIKVEDTWRAPKEGYYSFTFDSIEDPFCLLRLDLFQINSIEHFLL